jgi:uncharacterized phage protein (TIGR02218 family)
MLTQFISAPPTDVINLTLTRYHEGDGNAIVAWVGRIVNIGFDGFSAEVYCESIHTSFRHPTGRRVYQINCPHVLYGASCGVTQSSYKLTTTLSAISGLDITSTDFGLEVDGYYSGGIVELTSGGLVTKRFVTNHVGNVITLNLALTGAYVGVSVDAYPGCDHSTTACNSKFSNILNYGGQPFYPERNPYETVIF